MIGADSVSLFKFTKRTGRKLSLLLTVVLMLGMVSPAIAG